MMLTGAKRSAVVAFLQQQKSRNDSKKVTNPLNPGMKMLLPGVFFCGQIGVALQIKKRSTMYKLRANFVLPANG